ncbi:hypothetical protein PFISCL1PPCAC_25467, partial [Pristionchus fissidentatus]
HPMRSAISLLLICSITIQFGWCLGRKADNVSAHHVLISPYSINNKFDKFNTKIDHGVNPFHEMSLNSSFNISVNPFSSHFNGNYSIDGISHNSNSFYKKFGDMSRYIYNNIIDFVPGMRRKRSLEDDYANLLAEQKKYKANITALDKAVAEASAKNDQAVKDLGVAKKDAEEKKAIFEKTTTEKEKATTEYNTAFAALGTATTGSLAANTSYDPVYQAWDILNNYAIGNKTEMDDERPKFEAVNKTFKDAEKKSSELREERNNLKKEWDVLNGYLTKNTTKRNKANQTIQEIEAAAKIVAADKKKIKAVEEKDGLAETLKTATEKEKKTQDLFNPMKDNIILNRTEPFFQPNVMAWNVSYAIFTYVRGAEQSFDAGNITNNETKRRGHQDYGVGYLNNAAVLRTVQELNLDPMKTLNELVADYKRLKQEVADLATAKDTAQGKVDENRKK